VVLPSGVTAFLQPDSKWGGAVTSPQHPIAATSDENTDENTGALVRVSDDRIRLAGPGAWLVMRMLDVSIRMPPRFDKIHGIEASTVSVRSDCVHRLHLHTGATAYLQFSEVEGQYVQQLSGGCAHGASSSMVPSLALHTIHSNTKQHSTAGTEDLTSRFVLPLEVSDEEQQLKHERFSRQLDDIFSLADSNINGMAEKRYTQQSCLVHCD
jgi:hypothetical protein